jgi:hypothetical protein
MKQILMVIPFFPPIGGGGVYRPLGFVRHLEHYGWRPTVIAPRGSAFWIHDSSLVRMIPPSCEVVRTDTLSAQRLLAATRRNATGGSQVRSTRRFAGLRRLGSWFLIPDTYVGWYPFALHAGTRLLRRKKFDAIYSTSPPETSHLIARRLARMSGLPWVADFRDPWMNLHLFRPPTPVHACIHRRMERTVIRDAGIVVTNQWHFERMARQVDGRRRLTIISNGYEREDVEALEGVVPGSDTFRITHAGMLTQKRSAEPFLRGLKRFIDDTPGAAGTVRVTFIGPREDLNDAMARELDLSAVVTFRDTVSHEEALRLERASHILLLIKHVDELYRGIIPGKAYEYLGARRPILALVPDGEIKDLIMGLTRGEVGPQDDVEGIARSIGALYAKFRSGVLDADYDLSYCPRFERKTLAGALAEFLDSLERS